MENVFEAIKERYRIMESRNLKFGKDNIMGHIVSLFCKIQNTDEELFFDTYNYTTVGGKSASTCDIMVDGKSQMGILSVAEGLDKEISIAMLKLYMKKTEAPCGVVISGTVWSLIDRDGEEYSIDFTDSNITECEFEKFLIRI